MLGIDRRAARYTWSALMVLLLLYLVYLLRTTIFVFVVSLLLAYLLHPLVALLDRAIPFRRTRTLALALAYVILVGGLVFGGIQIGSRVVEQSNKFVRDFPNMLARWEQPSQNASPEVNSLKAQVLEKIEEYVRGGTGRILEALPQAGVKFLTVAGDLVYVVVIPVLAFFFLKDARALKQHAIDAIEDGRRRELVDDLLADVHLLLAHYMRVLVILSATSFTAYGIFLLVRGVPYTALLAVLAAMLEFVPLIGPLAAGAVVLLVTAVSGQPVLPVLIFVIVYRMFLDYVVSPHVMGRGIEMHPLLVLFGVFAGAEVAGVAGAFLSVPVLALLRIVYRRVRKARAAVDLAPVATP